MKSRKGQEMVTEQIIFIILNLIFFLTLIFFVIRSGSTDSVTEETYAKKIALIIDNMQPGMEVQLQASDLISKIQANNFNDFPITAKNGVVTVKVSSKGGYNFNYFSNVEIKQIGLITATQAIVIQT